MNKNRYPKELIGDFIMGLFPEIFDFVEYHIFTKYGKEEPELFKSTFDILDCLFLIQALQDWIESLQFLNYLSYMVGYQGEKHDRYVKLISSIAIVLGVTQIIIGIAQLYQINESS